MTEHEIYMKRCLQLAKNGLGTTYPNPLVGSVIVYNGKIIGEGWHKKAGEAHAEVNAINSVKDKRLLKNATIYVSLEPCSHFGKTPPCCDLILKHNIPNIVIGTIDPFSEVSGRSVQKMKNENKNVLVGILEKECQELNQRFFTFHNKKRPYIILKWAQSADGFIAPLEKEKKEPVWLSNSYSRQLAHKWRTEEQSILVGNQTVIDDNPSLTARDWKGNNPTRIVIDKNLKTDMSYKIYSDESKTIVLNSSIKTNSPCKNEFKLLNFESKKINVILDILFDNNIQSVIIEGGQKTLQTFIDQNVWDEARVFYSKINLYNGTEAPKLSNFEAIKTINITTDELKISRIC